MFEPCLRTRGLFLSFCKICAVASCSITAEVKLDFMCFQLFMLMSPFFTPWRSTNVTKHSGGKNPSNFQCVDFPQIDFDMNRKMFNIDINILDLVGTAVNYCE